MARRRLFDATYGTAKTKAESGGSKLPPPQTQPGVPLPFSAHGQLPPEMQQPLPQPGQMPQRQRPMPMSVGQGGSQLPPGIEEMIAQLIAQMGGGRGAA